jgi:hypothetical protein
VNDLFLFFDNTYGNFAEKQLEEPKIRKVRTTIKLQILTVRFSVQNNAREKETIGPMIFEED